MSPSRNLRKDILDGLPPRLEYNTNLIVSETSYSYDQYKMWYTTCESTVSVAVCVSIDWVCREELPLYLRLEEEKIVHNLGKNISW